MKVCERHNDAFVIYDDWVNYTKTGCPLCEAEGKIDELQREKEEQSKIIDELEAKE